MNKSLLVQTIEETEQLLSNEPRRLYLQDGGDIKYELFKKTKDITMMQQQISKLLDLSDRTLRDWKRNRHRLYNLLESIII